MRGLSFTPQDGVPQQMDVDFLDGIPDTLPDSSLVRMVYWGWDDPKDRRNLQFDPPLPIRFQFQYNRWSIDETGARVADKLSPWYPLKNAEDTNPGAGVSDLYRDRDSTTMRVGTFNYRFLVRSFDEQKKPDGTPAVVSFVGNFPPRIDSVKTGFWTRQGWPLARGSQIRLDEERYDSDRVEQQPGHGARRHALSLRGISSLRRSRDHNPLLPVHSYGRAGTMTGGIRRAPG